MKYKLLALDMDRTTLKDDSTISEKNKSAIKKYITSGGKVAIVSGRNTAMIKDCVEALDLEDNWNIGLNGMILFNYAKKEIIPLSSFEEQTYRKLIKIIRKNDNPTLVFSGDMIYYENDPFIINLSRKHGSDCLNKQENYMNIKNPMKIVIWFKKSSDKEYWDNICEQLQVEGLLAADNWYEIFTKGVSKYTGLISLAKKLNIKEDEIAAIGDHGNDVDMIKNAAFGVAVKNAIDEVKEVASLVLDKTNNEDAVYHLIEDYLLKE